MSTQPVTNRSEQERLQQQYDEIATLAGGLAHEIRNPLSTIQMNLDLLFEEIEESTDPTLHRVLTKLKTIRSQCVSLEEILEAFLQFARAGQLQLAEVQLGEFIAEFVEFYKAEATEHGIDVRTHCRSDLPAVMLDERLMKQALTNLVRNAQQAMPDGGTLELQTSTAGDQVVLEIIDSGCGMSAESLKKLFQVFFSTKPNGNGLGLPTVRKIVEAHGGMIQCDSAIQKGTRFTIRLPIAAS